MGWIGKFVPLRKAFTIETHLIGRRHNKVTGQGWRAGGVGPIYELTNERVRVSPGTVRQLNASGAQDLRAIHSLEFHQGSICKYYY